MEVNDVEELRRRELEGLRHALGALVLSALEDPDVVEVFRNPDGSLWSERFGAMSVIGEMSNDDVNALLRQVASSLPGQDLSYENAFVEGELPLDGSRFEGVAAPVVESPAFNIRKKASRVYPFSDYVAANILPFSIAEILREAVRDRKNILVVGGTGSGKTTFGNALLHAMAEEDPATRMLIMEDVRELQSALKNVVFMRSYEHADLKRLSQAAMRMRPDRISVGEVRAGGVALELVKAWNTGHPGGICTIHAGSAYNGLTRMDQLIGEVSAASQRELIGEAIQVVVYVCRTLSGRRVKEVIRVHGYDVDARKFMVETLYRLDDLPLNKLDFDLRAPSCNDDKIAELVATFKTDGQQCPITVVPTAQGRYLVKAGEPVVRACMALGWPRVQASVCVGG